MERGDRGQLFVLAGLAIAVLIVGVALLLNSSAYGANLAAQSAEGGVEEPREFLREAEIGSNRVMEHANYNNFSSYDTLRTNFTVGVRNWSDRAHDHEAFGGRGVEISALNVTNGSRITQDTDDRQFLNSAREANWSLATDIHGVRQFRMNVTTTGLFNDSSVVSQGDYQSSSYFRVNVSTNGGATFRNIYIYRNDPTATEDRVLLRVGSPSGLSPPCSVRANDRDRATLYLSDGLIGQDHCEQLDFLDDPAGPVAINYTNGDAIGGSYELFVDEPFGNVGDGDFSSPPPTHERAIYNATVNVNYTAENARLSGNRSATPDRRRFIGGGSSFTFAIPTGETVTFKEGGNIRVLNKSGSGTTYSGPTNPRGIGPTAVDIDSDGTDDTPFSRNNNDLRKLPGNDVMARNATADWTTLAAGPWQGGPDSFFYPGGAGAGGDPDAFDEIRQVTGPASNPQNDPVFTDGTNGVSDVVGIANMSSGDGDDELVYVDDSDEIRYVDGGMANSVGITLPSHTESPPIGTPADFNDNGTARVPYVDASNQLKLATKDGANETIPTPDDPLLAPMATLDWDADGNLDIIYINQSESALKVIYDVTGSNTVRPVNDTNGQPIVGIDSDVGVR